MAYRLTNSRKSNFATYMDPPAMSRKFREEKHVSGQMPSYIRPRSEDSVYLRALMKSALPLLSRTSASQAVSQNRV